jgi:hypothetical protein
MPTGKYLRTKKGLKNWDEKLNYILNRNIIRITEDSFFGGIEKEYLSNVLFMRRKMKDFNLYEKNCALSKVLAYLKLDYLGT